VCLVIHVSYLFGESINLYHKGKGFAEQKNKRASKERKKERKVKKKNFGKK